MNIILVGACGRMGKNVAEVAAERGVNIVAGVDVVPAQLSFPLYASIADVREHADAVIDFSSASGLEGTLSKCEKEHLPVVLAATGYTEADEARIRRAAEQIPVFQTGNLSLGVSLLQMLA